MKSFITITALLLFVLSLQVFIPDTGGNYVHADTTYVNPNGSSELAILMREMQAYSNQAKVDVKAGKAPVEYPVSFDKLHSAKITDSMEKSEFYNQFADLYIMSVKNYASSSPAQRIDTFNNMVSACLACHSQHCPGPVPVIRKLMIDPEK